MEKFPKKKLYATEPLIELVVSYTAKGKLYTEEYLFENSEDADLFAKDFLIKFFTKNYKNLSMDLTRRTKYVDLNIDTETVKKKVEKARPERQKRIEEASW